MRCFRFFYLAYWRFSNSKPFKTILIFANKRACGEHAGISPFLPSGACPFSKLKYFYPIRSVCTDYMHSLCEGVIKNLCSRLVISYGIIHLEILCKK